MQVNKWQNEQLEQWIPEVPVVHRVWLNTGALARQKTLAVLPTGDERLLLQREQGWKQAV